MKEHLNSIANINMHLKNIYADGELEEMATIKDFLIVRFEGNRSVARNVKQCNLDAIISVGFRVNVVRGIIKNCGMPNYRKICDQFKP